MNTLRRTGAVLSSGAAFFAAPYFLVPEIALNRNNVNEKVSKCADSLGRTAVDASTVPEACKTFEESFDRTATRVTRSNPAERSVKLISEETVFHLPAAEEFRENLVTPEDEDRAKDALLVTSGAASVFGMIIVGTITRRRPEDSAVNQNQ